MHFVYGLPKGMWQSINKPHVKKSVQSRRRFASQFEADPGNVASRSLVEVLALTALLLWFRHLEAMYVP